MMTSSMTSSVIAFSDLALVSRKIYTVSVFGAGGGGFFRSGSRRAPGIAHTAQIGHYGLKFAFFHYFLMKMVKNMICSVAYAFSTPMHVYKPTFEVNTEITVFHS